MRLKKSCFISLVLAIILSLSLAAPVMAVPQIPHAFYGTVTVGDGPAPNGVLISAKIGGVEYATTTTLDGKYGYSPTFKVGADDSDTPEVEGGVEGDTIVFYIEGVEVDTYTFSNGEVTPLDLEIEELPAPPPDGGAYYPPPPTIETSMFGIGGSFRISSTGEILETIVATSDTGDFTITIPEGTIALDEDGDPLSTLTVELDLDPPDPPAGAHIIGIPYKLGPSGATFSTSITIEFIVDPATLPSGIDMEDLVIAYYDEVAGEWVELPTTYDPATNTFTTSVAHFTRFAIIAVRVELPPVVVPPALAAFSVSSLSVLPATVGPGESVTIAVSIANTGGESGSYTVVLKIDGVKEAEERVTIVAGGSKTVTFSVTKEEAGSYTVTVDGLSSSFAVVPVVVPPAPAAFSVSYLSISPRLEVEPGETVTITVFVANTGGESGSYTVVLKIDGVKETDESVTIAAGESQKVSFSVTREEADSYAVTVDGLSGSFTVVAPPEEEEEEVPTKPGINWPAVGGGIAAGVIVIGLLIFFLVVRRRAA